MQNAIPDPRDDDIWVPAKRALAMMERYTKDRRSAKQSLAEHLRDGELASYATTVWDVRTKDVNSLWAENAERENLLTGVELEVEAWRDSECWRNDCDDWRWPFGNFCVTFQRKPTYMHAYHRVSFKRADLKRILDGRLPSNGGRKPKEIEWRAFWHTMIGLERQGLLKTFTTQAELSEAVLEEIRDELSEQSIRTDVSQIFKKFCVSAP